MSRDFPDNLAARMIQALILSIIISPWLPPVVLLIIALLTPFFVKRPWPIRGFPEGIFIGFLLLSAISWCFNPSWIYGIPVGLIPMAVFLAYYLLAVWIKRGLDWSWYEIQRLYLCSGWPVCISLSSSFCRGLDGFPRRHPGGGGCWGIPPFTKMT